MSKTIYHCKSCDIEHDRGDVTFAHLRWPEAFGVDESAQSVPVFAGFDRFLREMFPRHATPRDLIRALLFLAPFEGGNGVIAVSDRALTKHAGIPAGSLVEARAVKGFGDLCPFKVGQQWEAGRTAAVTTYNLGAVIKKYGEWARKNKITKTKERAKAVEAAPEPEPATAESEPAHSATTAIDTEP